MTRLGNIVPPTAETLLNRAVQYEYAGNRIGLNHDHSVWYRDDLGRYVNQGLHRDWQKLREFFLSEAELLFKEAQALS